MRRVGTIASLTSQLILSVSKLTSSSLRWTPDTLAAKNATSNNSHRYGGSAGDPVAKWARCQPGAARRQHHGIVANEPGAGRKTAGATQGNRPQAFPRGRLLESPGPDNAQSLERAPTPRRALGVQLNIGRDTGAPAILTKRSEAATGRADGALPSCRAPVFSYSAKPDC